MSDSKVQIKKKICLCSKKFCLNKAGTTIRKKTKVKTVRSVLTLIILKHTQTMSSTGYYHILYRNRNLYIIHH